MDNVITLLDAAHIALSNDPENDALHLRFYAHLSDGELFLLLDSEPAGQNISPKVFDLDDGRFVLAFDNEERLAAFSGGIAPYAALPGRVLAGMLCGQGIGLGVNLGVAPSSMLLPPEAMDWLSQTLAHAPQEHEAAPRNFHPPQGISEGLIAALEAKLARAGGLAAAALLAGVTYQDGRRGHILAFIGAQDGAQNALARAVSEALVFSGIDAGVLDVAFFTPDSRAAQMIALHGLRFDLPAPETPKVQHIAPPGMDPERPPKLR